MKIVDLDLEGVKQRLADRDITLKVSAEAMKELARRGFDPDYGARPLKRLIQKEVQDKIALELLKGGITDSSTVDVGYDQKKHVFEFQKA